MPQYILHIETSSTYSRTEWSSVHAAESYARDYIYAGIPTGERVMWLICNAEAAAYAHDNDYGYGRGGIRRLYHY